MATYCNADLFMCLNIVNKEVTCSVDVSDNGLHTLTTRLQLHVSVHTLQR